MSTKAEEKTEEKKKEKFEKLNEEVLIVCSKKDRYKSRRVIIKE